ncbi:MAG: hypothetical protein E6K44_01145 [Gammaproteobacteria bacterium]|nr:MAG: hypothetical protein E6K44_01145 [Gammaproteobacteria bacterium]
MSVSWRWRSSERAFWRCCPTPISTEGKLFGSIGTSDIAEACTREGFNIERSEVRLPAGPLRMLGEHLISLHLHADVDVPLHVTIVAEE